MGHKVHPYGFRLGIIKDWKAHWYASNSTAYRNLVIQDLRLRESIKNEYKAFSDAGIANVEIGRGAQDSVINIHSARPGILIGRGGGREKGRQAKLAHEDVGCGFASRSAPSAPFAEDGHDHVATLPVEDRARRADSAHRRSTLFGYPVFIVVGQRVHFAPGQLPR